MCLMTKLFQYEINFFIKNIRKERNFLFTVLSRHMSCLSLPDDEFETSYTRHLLIRELCPVEVSLLIFSLEIQQRREIAYASYFSYTLTGINKDDEALLVLGTLEDRFINTVVIAMLADLNLGSVEIRCDDMRKARDLFGLRKEDELSSIELHLKARVLESNFVRIERFEVIRLYEMGVADNFLPSFSALIMCLYGVPRTTENVTRLIGVMEKGAKLGCYTCRVLLANEHRYNSLHWYPMSRLNTVKLKY